MNSNDVRYTLDPDHLPALTPQQTEELHRLKGLDDSQIDTSDIPELPEAFFANAVQGRFYKPTKTATTVRIDSDVLAWLKQSGRGYQTRLNAILRREMLEHLKR